MKELAPPELGIPPIVFIQSIAVEYAEEYVVVEPMNGRARYVVSSFGYWRWQC